MSMPLIFGFGSNFSFQTQFGTGNKTVSMVFKNLKEDLSAFIDRDPAARSRWEVAILYQGFHAILFYRISSAFWRLKLQFLGRLISQFGRLFTGIEIHPGAKIGKRLVIDHGSGVVIGETAEIGDDVTLYHDVTLGGVAPSVESMSQVGQKRHPTIENRVIIGSGAQILGPIRVGKDARVGSNAVVTQDVPSGVTAVGIPARVIMPKEKNLRGTFQPYATTPEAQSDPMSQSITNLRAQILMLMNRVEELEEEIKNRDVKKNVKVVNGVSEPN